MAAPTFTARQRRDRMVRRHHLAPPHAPSVEAVVHSVVALHATESASPYLSVLARCPDATLDDVADLLYGKRTVVRMMAMRRTLFVVPLDRVDVVHTAVSLDVGARLRRALVKTLGTIPTDPPVGPDVEAWLDDVGAAAVRALQARGSATALQLSADEPRLRTALLPTTDKKWDVRRTINGSVLTWLGAAGHVVRGQPRGAWTSRAHTWEPASAWWPDGLGSLDVDAARSDLAADWLRAFGPATVEDLKWWTGWSLGTTRAALARLDTVDVDLDGQPGLCLADDVDGGPHDAGSDGGAAPEPTAALLPALDPSPMGWRHRDWFFAVDRRPWFDTNGNLGPTVWWDGEVVGGWQLVGGRIRWRLLVDRGEQARDAVAAAVARLEERIEGTDTIIGYPTPLEAELRAL